MGKTLSQEEQRQMLEKLESTLVATRFMTLKYLNYTILQDKVDYAKMDVETPEFTKGLARVVEHISKNDAVEMVKREAVLGLENLKKKINPVALAEAPACTSCGERLIVSYKFCTKCGAGLKGQKWLAAFKTCEKCQSPVDQAWFNCATCGNVLIKKVEVAKTCPMCKKNIDPNWVMCPFCGSKLKLV
ncbi:Double zinc ribbon [uncultured archaeon]|nr:Double zinc ribbon [uncultured archaeon]